MFALINGNASKNDSASVGGDIAQSELLGYSGDSRLDAAGTIFQDNSGPARGLIPPKIGLEFDTKVNYSSTLESSLRYCDSGSNLNADTRNDPGSNGKDAVQHVFWGNSLLEAPCRRQPFCGGNAACEGDPLLRRQPARRGRRRHTELGILDGQKHRKLAGSCKRRDHLYWVVGQPDLRHQPRRVAEMVL